MENNNSVCYVAKIDETKVINLDYLIWAEKHDVGDSH
jgi:hypothetical protein